MAAPELERLIRIIVEEVAAAQTTAAPVRCGCHAVLFECCPDRLRGVIEAEIVFQLVSVPPSQRELT